jgi:YebC/PmpR family DNA-binding regulatory protein
MAGHSKWANIQHRKNAQDAKRGKLFTRLIREITVAARMGGGGDPATNPRLRLAVDRGLVANMTKDTIERAIKRGCGDQDGSNYEEVRYEGYGPGGVAIMVDCMTDNRNRTVAEVRHAFSKFGGNMGADGSVAYLFTPLGVLSYPPGSDFDALMEAALEAGAQDIVKGDDGSVEVITTPEDYHAVSQAMKAAGFDPEHSELVQRPAITLMLEGEQAQAAMVLLERLEDLDDVQTVHTNAEFPDDLLPEG